MIVCNNSHVTVNFKLAADCLGGSKKSRQLTIFRCIKEAIALPGYLVFLHRNMDAQGAQFCFRWLKPFVKSFLRVTSTATQTSWRLGSFLSAKCETNFTTPVLPGRLCWVQCLHLTPFHIARWMLTTAWPFCKSMSLSRFSGDLKLLFKQDKCLMIWVWSMINDDTW